MPQWGTEIDSGAIVSPTVAALTPVVQGIVTSALAGDSRLLNIETLVGALTSTAATRTQAQTIIDQNVALAADVAALPTAVSAGLAATIIAGVVATLRPDLQYYGADLDGADLESLVAVVGVSTHIEIWGWLSYGGAFPTFVSLRSGNTANNASSVSILDLAGVYPVSTLKPIGNASSNVCMLPGSRPLWRTANGTGLIAKKEDASGEHRFDVWFKSVAD